jgi:hypothetical protein
MRHGIGHDLREGQDQRRIRAPMERNFHDMTTNP